MVDYLVKQTIQNDFDPLKAMLTKCHQQAKAAITILILRLTTNHKK